MICSKILRHDYVVENPLKQKDHGWKTLQYLDLDSQATLLATPC